MSSTGDRLEYGADYVVGHPWARYIEPLPTGCYTVLFVGAGVKAGAELGVLRYTVSA